jgi:hypothetical protein
MRDKKWFNCQKREAAKIEQLQATGINSDSEGSMGLEDPTAAFTELLEAANDMSTIQSLLPVACKMDTAAQIQFTRTALKHLYPFEPRQKQVEAVL